MSLTVSLGRLNHRGKIKFYDPHNYKHRAHFLSRSKTYQKKIYLLILFDLHLPDVTIYYTFSINKH
jgi:hypothetical protein